MALTLGSHGPYPFLEGRHLIVALREFVYCDESGIHDGASYCVVAGYRGSPKQWGRFKTEWNAALLSYGVKVFHSNVFFNRKVIQNSRENPYLNWNDEKAHQFLGLLLGLIRKRRIYPVGGAVNVTDFESASFGERCILAGYEPTASLRQHRRKPAPYHLAVQIMLRDTVKNCHPDTEIHFVLGLQKALQQRALEGYYLTKELGLEGHAKQLKGMGFESPEDFPGLQAADLFVHQWYQALSRGRKLGRESQKAMNQLTHNRHDIPLRDATGIEAMFREFGVTDQDRAILRTMREPSG